MKSYKANKIIAIVLVFFFCISGFAGVSFAYARQFDTDAENQSETYDNPIYRYGFEDTYVLNTTDSVITVKTGLPRNIPEVFGEFLAEDYPGPSNKISDTSRLEEVLRENQLVMENAENDIALNRLKKHIAADSQYGVLPDSATAVEKIIYVNTNLKDSHPLAVYAPAGEIVTVTIPEKFMYLAAGGRLSIRVGLYEANTTSLNCNSKMPVLGNNFSIKQTVTKVGNPFGGMVYLYVENDRVPAGLTIPVTVSGGVDTPYYDFASTTLEEWEQSRKAPGLFAELRTPYMRVMVPASELRDVINPYDALSFWLNASALSTYVFGEQTINRPITIIYDYFIAAGSAVAFVGAWKSFIPVSWFSGFIDYENLMKNGQWGEIHEFNHHWQGHNKYNGNWGVGDTGEVTNNVLNVAAYILYTNVAAYRDESGLTGSNKAADPYCNLKEVLTNNSGGPVTTFYMYSSFMHEFGVGKFLEIVKSNYFGGVFNGTALETHCPKGEGRYNDFAYRACVITGKDLSYYFKNILRFELSEETAAKIKNLDFEPYLPIQNLYAAGIKGIETGRPFYIPNAEYTFDFPKFTQSAEEYEIISVSNPKYGTLTRKSYGVYIYNPSNLDNKLDEFELNFKIDADGISQNRTLVCKIGINYNTSLIKKYNIDEANTQKAIELSKTMTPYEITYSNELNYKTDNGKNFTKGTGYFTVNDSREYEIQAYGDDKIKFITEAGGKEYISETTKNLSSAEAAYVNDSCTHFSIYLKAGIFYPYTLYTNNTGGAGYASVGIRRTDIKNSKWNSIANVYPSMADTKKTTGRSFMQPDLPYYVRPLCQSIDYGAAARVLVTPQEHSGDGQGPSAIIDKDKSTYFHSKYSGARTAFPHDYIIDLGGEMQFNKIEIYTRSSQTNGAIGDYIVYIADKFLGDETVWTEIVIDKTRYLNPAAPNHISAKFTAITAKYLKFSALNNKYGNDFTVIASIELFFEVSVPNIIAHNSSLIRYEGNWDKNADGNFVNGATYNSSGGKLFFGFHGAQLAIYSAKNARIKMRINYKDWMEFDLKGCRVQFLTLYSIDDYMIDIEAVSGELALDWLATDGYFIKYSNEEIQDPPDENLPKKIWLIIVLIAGGALTATALTVLFVRQKRKKQR